MTAGATQGRDDRPIDLLVLGLGNVLLSDDGVGPAALARLARNYRFPAGVRLEDGGTLGMSLLGLISDARRVILVDAVGADDPPGTLVRLEGDEVLHAVRDRLSPHQVGVAEVMAAARLIDRYPDSVKLLGIVPQTLALSFGCSPAVQASIDALVVAVAEEVEAQYQ